MKFIAAVLALAAVVNAATGTISIALTTPKVDGVCGNKVTILATTDAAHDAVDQYIKITLPPGVSIKSGAQTIGVNNDYTFSCTVTGTGANTATTADTYTVTEDKGVIEIKKKGTSSYCAAGVTTLVLNKACVLIKDIDQSKLKVANSKVTAEQTTPVAASAATVAVSASTAGTLSALKIPSTIKDTSEFSIKFTPSANSAETEFLTVYIPGYTVAATPKCKVGTTDAATVSGSTTAGFGYIQVTGATSLWTASTATTLTCATGVTAPTAVQAANKIYIVIGTTAQANAISELTLPAVVTKAPTASPTKAPTAAPFSAAPRSAAATCAAGFISAVVAYFLF